MSIPSHNFIPYTRSHFRWFIPIPLNSSSTDILLPSILYNELLSYLDIIEQTRIKRFIYHRDAVLALIGRTAIQKCIQLILNYNIKQLNQLYNITLNRTYYGKPILQYNHTNTNTNTNNNINNNTNINESKDINNNNNNNIHFPLTFNISHHGTYVFLVAEYYSQNNDNNNNNNNDNNNNNNNDNNNNDTISIFISREN
jgi:hypothetical protein